MGGGTAGYTIVSTDLAENELNDQVSGLSLTQQSSSYQATLSGTPTFTGSALPTSPVAVPFSVTATDNSSPPITVTSWYTLSISPKALTINTSYLPPAAAGVSYYQSAPADSDSGNDGFPIPIQLSVSGGSGTGYSFAVNTGGLPPGLGLLSNGQIIGQPWVTDAPGDYTFTVTATDSANNQTSRQFDLLLLPAATATTPPDYTPQQVIQAYGLNKIILGGGVIGNGAGQTVVICEPTHGSNFCSSTDQTGYDSSDLYTFDNLFGLVNFGDGSTPGLPIFLQLNDQGGTTVTAQPPKDKTNGEETQDIEWVHAIAPLANIIVLEGTIQTDITTALSGTLPATIGTLADGTTLPPVSVVSISDATNKIPDATFVAPNTNVTVVVSAGDRIGPAVGASGGVIAPSSNVLSVGETQLSLNASGAYLGEVGLIGTGAGVSGVEPAPSFQQFLNSPVQQFSSSNRATPDVAILGSVSSAAATYNSLLNSSADPNNWGSASGTSLAAPLWAGLLAIVNQGRQIAGEGPLDGPTQTLPLLYQLPSSDFHKITQLDDGTAIQPGYNLHTGLGSPVANLLVADLIGGQLNASNQLVGGKITISGTVFNDLNLNGQLASNDPGLAGWTVTLGSIQNGQFVPGTSAAASTTTNASGGFSFVVAPGLYAVQVHPVRLCRNHDDLAEFRHRPGVDGDDRHDELWLCGRPGEPAPHPDLVRNVRARHNSRHAHRHHQPHADQRLNDDSDGNCYFLRRFHSPGDRPTLRQLRNLFDGWAGGRRPLLLGAVQPISLAVRLQHQYLGGDVGPGSAAAGPALAALATTTCGTVNSQHKHANCGQGTAPP